MIPVNVASATGVDATAAAMPWKSSVPNCVNSHNMPSRKPKSPIRFTTNAFLPASAAACFVNQNPISR